MFIVWVLGAVAAAAAFVLIILSVSQSVRKTAILVLTIQCAKNHSISMLNSYYDHVNLNKKWNKNTRMRSWIEFRFLFKRFARLKITCIYIEWIGYGYRNMPYAIPRMLWWCSFLRLIKKMNETEQIIAINIEYTVYQTYLGKFICSLFLGVEYNFGNFSI